MVSSDLKMGKARSICQAPLVIKYTKPRIGKMKGMFRARVVHVYSAVTDLLADFSKDLRPATYTKVPISGISDGDGISVCSIINDYIGSVLSYGTGA